ncbi:hypothetical protein GQ649_26300 [Rhodococcus sp. DSM 6344]|nr:hypothetical protein [Rhodococcus erythropolis]
MTDTDLGAHAGDIFAKAFTLGYETGRKYIPAGGMALTAEQVEDVRTMLWSPGVTALPAFRRLRALFPATEPAEEAPNLAAVAQEPRRFDPADECQNDNHDPGCTCGAQHWMTTPAPAEPAEEETKAEHNASVARREALGRVAQQLYEQSFDGCDGTFYHDFGRALEDFLPSQGWTRIPASLPVVPAPTETPKETA